MADCVVVEVSPVREDSSVNEDDLSVSEDSSNNSDSVKNEYFVISESAKLCSKFQLKPSELHKRVMSSSDTEEFSSVLKSINEENADNCLKKRCTDRYDSSESSDSGVATLSCTDCSSAGSSSTSDITEPGSPFSTSSHSESDVEGSPSKMPPTQSSDTSAWSWADRSPTQQCYYLHSKRFKIDNNNGVRTKCCKQQGKITEYFRAQHKTQKKCDTKSKIDVVREKLAVHISGPVAAQLPYVFQHQRTVLKTEPDVTANNNRISVPSTPLHRKTLKSCQPDSQLQVTSVFRKPDSPCTVTESDDSVSLSKPKPPPSSEGSTPNVSPSENSSSPLSISTNEQCSDKASLPSPILRTPSTIRFPARNGWKGHFLSDIVCRWSNCEEAFNTSTALLEHLQVKHVNSQSLKETFVCLWIGCKVYNRASCSRSWLERHVLGHGGNKPFRCIFDGCGQRFSSQSVLEKHVHQHFNQTENNSNNGLNNKRGLESTPNKLFRRNGKKLRYRRQPFSARMFDYIDNGIMEGIQHSLLEVTKLQRLGQLDFSTGNTVSLHSRVIGKRTSTDGTVQVLLRWYPQNIVGDEWMPQSEVTQTRKVAWSACQDWCQPPLFHKRPRHNQRKQSTAR